jgi:hypothetical protein
LHSAIAALRQASVFSRCCLALRHPRIAAVQRGDGVINDALNGDKPVPERVLSQQFVLNVPRPNRAADVKHIA